MGNHLPNLEGIHFTVIILEPRPNVRVMANFQLMNDGMVDKRMELTENHSRNSIFKRRMI